MSNHASHAVWAERRAGRLPGGAVLVVALAMADRTNGNGELSAGMRRLAADTGLGLGTVHRATRAVLGAGLYRVGVTAAGRRATTYRFALSPTNAKLGDNGAVAFDHGNAIAFQGNGVAFQTAGRSVPSEDAYKEEPNLEPENSSRDLAENVDALRARLRPAP